MTMNLKEFGIFFAELREKSGYRSQRELAEKSGVSHSTINRLEAGTNKTSIETLKSLAPYLRGIEYNELIKKAGYLEETSTLSSTAKRIPQNENAPVQGLAFIDGGVEELDEEEMDYLKESLELFRRMKERKAKEPKGK